MPNAARVQTAISSIEAFVQAIEQLTPEQLAQCLVALRSEIQVLETNHFFSASTNLATKITVLQALQRIAFHDAVGATITDVAGLCVEKWLQLLGENPGNAGVLRGLAEYWLLKAKPAFQRIGAQGEAELSEEENNGAVTASHANTPDHVEARGNLLPAADYLRQAVDSARHNGTLDGPLLAVAAETFINLGTVSSGQEGETYFHLAVRYARAGSLLPGFSLPEHLQRYLEEYGRFVDD